MRNINSKMVPKMVGCPSIQVLKELRENKTAIYL